MYVTHLENHISRSQNFDGHLGKHESIQGKDWQVNLCDVDDETRCTCTVRQPESRLDYNTAKNTKK